MCAVAQDLKGVKSGGGGQLGHLEVDQMFLGDHRPVGGIEECLGGIQLLQCEAA